jgi:hypothetical protein
MIIYESIPYELLNSKPLPVVSTGEGWKREFLEEGLMKRFGKKLPEGKSFIDFKDSIEFKNALWPNEPTRNGFLLAFVFSFNFKVQEMTEEVYNSRYKGRTTTDRFVDYFWNVDDFIYSEDCKKMLEDFFIPKIEHRTDGLYHRDVKKTMVISYNGRNHTLDNQLWHTIYNYGSCLYRDASRISGDWKSKGLTITFDGSQPLRGDKILARQNPYPLTPSQKTFCNAYLKIVDEAYELMDIENIINNYNGPHGGRFKTHIYSHWQNIGLSRKIRSMLNYKRGKFLHL